MLWTKPWVGCLVRLRHFKSYLFFTFVYHFLLTTTRKQPLTKRLPPTSKNDKEVFFFIILESCRNSKGIVLPAKTMDHAQPSSCQFWRKEDAYITTCLQNVHWHVCYQTIMLIIIIIILDYMHTDRIASSTWPKEDLWYHPYRYDDAVSVVAIVFCFLCQQKLKWRREQDSLDN